MRLIDADILKEIKFTIPPYRGCGKNPLTVLTGLFITAIDTQPTIDAVPVVHGHWICKNVISELQITCNKCRYSYIEADSECEQRYKYCPDCGAKMDEEVKNDSRIKNITPIF